VQDALSESMLHLLTSLAYLLMIILFILFYFYFS